ncbi:Zn(2)-C6 fungal-type domain-containing protein [Fusarium sp. LHS14.1]|nr:Zn(2)-C6 fungal-type domain-containing protein [Fusarium sp. LHS14.1]
MSRKSTNSGCWICRLRRKKCDEVHPTCGDCDALGLDCLYSDTKPEWMDGDVRQKQMSTAIKTRAKKGQRSRHAAKAMGDDFINTSAIDYHSAKKKTALSEASLVSERTSSIEAGFPIQGPNNGPASSLPIISRPSLTMDEEAEINFTTIYLDNVFPSLFPFYHPSVLDNGRHWVLHLLRRNRVVLHAALSLSSYFFAVALDHAHLGENHHSCKSLVWNELAAQAERTIRLIQKDMQSLQQRGVAASLEDSVNAMQSIIHVLVFDVAVGRTRDWDIHLRPAIALFRDILTHHGTRGSQISLDAILDQMRRPKPSVINMIKPSPATPSQSAFRFFTAMLLHMDIVSSTALEQSPRLLQYHHVFLDDSTGDAKINLEGYVGCQNWVLVSIAESSALGSWKKASDEAGTLSIVDLVRRAEPIFQQLDDGLARLSQAPSTPSRPRPFLSEVYYNQEDLNSALATRIWALAAKIYLTGIVSGWQPRSLPIRDSVSLALSSLQEISSPSMLRALGWPLFVVSCMASREQQEAFRVIFRRLDDLRAFASVGGMLDSVEAIWEQSCIQDNEGWSISKCFSINGEALLLI